MQKLVLILLAFLAVFTYIGALREVEAENVQEANIGFRPMALEIPVENNR